MTPSMNQSIIQATTHDTTFKATAPPFVIVDNDSIEDQLQHLCIYVHV